MRAAAIREFRTPKGAKLAFTTMGFGTAPLGNLYRPLDETTARETLAAAWAAGCRYFDTAPLYGLGLAETRLNAFLREHRDAPPLVSTKIGRLLEPCAPAERSAQEHYFDTPARRVRFDYSYDGVMRSLEASLERLGLDRVDILFCHDIDPATHGSAAISESHIRSFMEGGYRALDALRAAGTIRAFGAGLNDWRVCERLARAADFDLFLLAGRYTLLEQEPLDGFLPLCVARGIGIVLGGPYNSGILATGPRPGASYNYAPAPSAILERAARLERVCAAHGVALPVAALAFPLAHPAIVSIIPGGCTPDEVRRNAAQLDIAVPAALWRDLKAAQLLHPDAPVPQ